jgi:hypothetical protein
MLFADFDTFYSEKLEPEMGRLRSECRSTDIWHLIGVLAVGALIISLIAYTFGDFKQHNGGLVIILSIAIGLVSLLKYIRKNDSFTEDFKASVIRQIIAHVSPGIEYKPELSINEEEYIASGLFGSYAYFSGDDYMDGIINNVHFHCSEVHTQSDSGGLRDIEDPTIFKGLLFVANINTSYSIQTPEMRGRILALEKHLNKRMNCSFVGGRCYVAVPFQGDLLEPTDYEVDDKIELRKYFTTISFIPAIINGLGLERLV